MNRKLPRPPVCPSPRLQDEHHDDNSMDNLQEMDIMDMSVLDDAENDEGIPAEEYDDDEILNEDPEEKGHPFSPAAEEEEEEEELGNGDVEMLDEAEEVRAGRALGVCVWRFTSERSSPC